MLLVTGTQSTRSRPKDPILILVIFGQGVQAIFTGGCNILYYFRYVIYVPYSIAAKCELFFEISRPFSDTVPYTTVLHHTYFPALHPRVIKMAVHPCPILYYGLTTYMVNCIKWPYIPALYCDMAPLYIQ